jgi:hypothetical protein
VSAVAQGPAEQQKPSDQPKAATAAAPKTAAEQFKNIQVLKTVAAEDLLPTMRYIGASLGVDCNFCHVRENGEFMPEKDDKKEKQTAREMMKMVIAINQDNFEGKQEVSCSTCHNGHEHPVNVPPVTTEAAVKERLAARAAQQARPGGQPAPATPPAREERPSAESIFQKYEQAIGGHDAIAKITSRYIKGNMVTPFGTSNFEQYNKAPNKSWVSTSTPRGQRVTVWDGSQGWTKDNKVEPMRDTGDMKVNADFYRSLEFAGRYKGARVMRKEKVGDRDAWVVGVRIPDSPLTDMLYFDTDSGLLLRRTTLRRTALGPLPATTDFADYHDVNGLKMPFKVTVTTTDSVQNLQVTEMKVNAPVEDSRFAMPAE